MNSTFSSGNSSPIFRHKLYAAWQTCNVCRGNLQVAALLEGIEKFIAKMTRQASGRTSTNANSRKQACPFSLMENFLEVA